MTTGILEENWREGKVQFLHQAESHLIQLALWRTLFLATEFVALAVLLIPFLLVVSILISVSFRELVFDLRAVKIWRVIYACRPAFDHYSSCP